MTKPHKPVTSASPDRRPATERMQRLLDRLGEIRKLLDTPAEALVAAALRKHARWGSHTPQMARAGARMMEIMPEEFKGLPFTASDLKQEEETLDELLSVTQLVDRFVADLNRRTTQSKNRITEMVITLEDSVNASLGDPRTPPDQRTRMSEASAPFRSIATDRFQGILAARRDTLKTRASADDRVAKAEDGIDLLAMENNILRGKNATESTLVRPQPAVPRKARRTRR